MSRVEKSLEIINAPHVESRPATGYVGIRTIAPFRGMLKVRDELLTTLDDWLPELAATAFMRLWVVDMGGEMDIEVGVVTAEEGLVAHAEGDPKFGVGVFPAGRYATLTYRDHSVRANKALIGWVEEQGLELDQREGPGGNHFACRYEAYLTDRQAEPRKTKWEVELAIRIRD